MAARASLEQVVPMMRDDRRYRPPAWCRPPGRPRGCSPCLPRSTRSGDRAARRRRHRWRSRSRRGRPRPARRWRRIRLRPGQMDRVTGGDVDASDGVGAFEGRRFRRGRRRGAGSRGGWGLGGRGAAGRQDHGRHDKHRQKGKSTLHFFSPPPGIRMDFQSSLGVVRRETEIYILVDPAAPPLGRAPRGALSPQDDLSRPLKPGL